MDLFRLDTCIEIQISISDALFSLDLVADLSTGRVEEQACALRCGVQGLRCRWMLIDNSVCNVLANANQLHTIIQTSHLFIHEPRAKYAEAFCFEAVCGSSYPVSGNIVVLSLVARRRFVRSSCVIRYSLCWIHSRPSRNVELFTLRDQTESCEWIGILATYKTAYLAATLGVDYP